MATDGFAEVPGTNGNLFKKVLQEGTGDLPPPRNTWMKVHYTGTLENGSKFDSSRDKNRYFEFTLGVGQVIKAWDIGMATMRKGERSVLKCSSDFGYGDNGYPPVIPPKATLIFDVEVFDFKQK